MDFSIIQSDISLQYGLVKVGNDLPNLEKAKAVRHRKAIQDKFDKLFAKIR